MALGLVLGANSFGALYFGPYSEDCLLDKVIVVTSGLVGVCTFRFGYFNRSGPATLAGFNADGYFDDTAFVGFPPNPVTAGQVWTFHIWRRFPAWGRFSYFGVAFSTGGGGSFTGNVSLCVRPPRSAPPYLR